MKKYSLLFFIVISIMNATGQINPEKSYNYSLTTAQLDEQEYKFFLMDVVNSECRIYNLDHSLYKTISLQVPEGYYLSDIKFVSRKLFNNDDLIELLYIYTKTTESSGTYIYSYGLKVINESGNQLLDLPEGGFAEIMEVPGKSLLLAYQYTYADGYYLTTTNVYNLGISTKSSVLKGNDEIQFFPNPADNKIMITDNSEILRSEASLKITDIAGKSARIVSLPTGNKSWEIPVDQLKAGFYIFTIFSEGRKIISKRIEIK